MTLYIKRITVEPNSEKVEEIELEGRLLEKIEYRFPAGVLESVSIQVFYGLEQISPHPEGESVTGEDETIVDDIYWQFPESKLKLKIKAESVAEDYAHTITVRFYVSPYRFPVWVMKVISLLSDLVERFKKAFGE